VFGGVFVAEYTKCPEHYIFGLDIGTRSIVGTVGYREDEKNFRVVGQVVRMHETRSMLDGQIHDIDKVAETILQVKNELEQLLQYKLENVCIAAAGRVLKTVNVRADYEFEEERIIDEEQIHTLELIGMEQAYASLQSEMNQQIHMYCVGSTVIHYYLNDYIMLSLKGHKGKKISADFLATFLPDEVIQSLYAAVEKSGLKVSNLTLEPIAASELAIPVNFRLLNIALVDVGAGTSDISITKDGSIIGYGMIPTAGDSFTEEIAKRYLVDFSTAENIKIGCFSGGKIEYKDIMGIAHTVTPEEVLEGLEDTISNTTQKVAEHIKELNGGVPVSAVFIVGGGGKLPNFASSLAEHLDLPKERVAVRGEEVFVNIHFEQKDINLDSTLVTPIGICLSHLAKNTNFIMVSVNGTQIKLYDNNRLTVMDAAIQIGFPKENLFPKRGKTIPYYVNNESRLLRGEAGDGAKITVNGKEESLNTKISVNDIIEIISSTEGSPAHGTVGELPEYKRKGNIELSVNGKKIACPRMVKVNGTVALESYEIIENDRIDILDYYTIEEVMEVMDMPAPDYFYINGKEAEIDDRIYDGFSVTCEWENEEEVMNEGEELHSESEHTLQTEDKKVSENIGKELSESKTKAEGQKQSDQGKIAAEEQNRKDIHILVNGTQVTLSGKASYIFVDILDFYPFDTSTAGGSSIIMTVNGLEATFSTPIRDGEQVELYWKE
jgi:cell division protein FtsA